MLIWKIELKKIQRPTTWRSFSWTVFRMKKYHTVWGLSEANHVTCYYVTYELNHGVNRSNMLRWAFPFPLWKQNMNILGNILHKLWTLLCTLFKGPNPSAICKKKEHVTVYISFLTPVQKFQTSFVLSVQENFSDQSFTFLQEP